jgi:hypothetical protein
VSVSRRDRKGPAGGKFVVTLEVEPGTTPAAVRLRRALAVCRRWGLVCTAAEWVLPIAPPVAGQGGAGAVAPPPAGVVD